MSISALNVCTEIGVSINDLRAMVICEICGNEASAPVDEPWQFRLNGFLLEALRAHGIAPLFWVLNKVQAHNDSSFWFEGPLNIFLTKEKAATNCPDTDIDLTIIENGVVRMCEAKQSERNFSDPEGFATTMIRLRPDIATVAIMQPTNRSILEKFGKFSELLRGTDIKPELLTLDTEHDISSSPYI